MPFMTYGQMKAQGLVSKDATGKIKITTRGQKRILSCIDRGMAQLQAALCAAKDASIHGKGAYATKRMEKATDFACMAKNLFADARDAMQEHDIEMRDLRNDAWRERAAEDCGEEDE